MTLDPDVESRLHNARAALSRRHYWLAVPHLKAVVEAEPAHVEAQELLGIAQCMANNATAARHAFREATRLDPTRASAHFNFALCLFNLGDLDEAAEEVHATLFLDPSNSGAHNLQAQINEKLKFRGITDEGFALVGSRGREPLSTPGLETLACPICGAMNRVMAKVCKKCNSFIPEMPDVVAVE